MEKVLSVGRHLIILVSILPSILAAPRPEAPVANYIANFYDPHPISTYGAHPFHINSHSSETPADIHRDDVHVGNSRRGTSHEDHDDYSYNSYSQPRYRPRSHHSYGNSNKYPKYSGEHHDDHDAQDSPSYSSPSKSGYNPYKAGRDYSPFQGYAPEGWFNTMQGGYDDYGYNYDRAGSNSPAYKGPPRKSSYNGGYGSTGPSSMEHDHHPSVYSFGAGAPEFVSYTEDDEPKHTFSTLKSGNRRPSNGYGEDPYFTFGPKKKTSTKPVSSLFDILSAVTGESSKSSSGSYRLGGNKYSGPKASSNKYSSSGRPKSSSRPSSSYYDKDYKDDHPIEDDEPIIFEEFEQITDDSNRKDVLHDDADEQYGKSGSKRGQEDKHRSHRSPSTRSKKHHNRHNKRQNSNTKQQLSHDNNKNNNKQRSQEHSRNEGGERRPQSKRPRSKSPLDLLRRLRRKPSRPTN